MAVSSRAQPTLLDLPLEVFIDVCGQLDFRDLIRVAAACKRLRHGDGGMETAELPTKSPVVTALREHAFPGGVGIPSTRRTGCCESWVAYLSRCARQRRCREAPPVAAGHRCSLFVDAAGRLLSCGKGAEGFHGEAEIANPLPTTVTTLAEIRMRSVAVGVYHYLALGWDGRVYSWGDNDRGQLGHGDKVHRASPVLVEGLEGVRGIAGAVRHSFAVTHSGDAFQWGESFWTGAEDSLLQIIVEGLRGVRVRCVCGRLHVGFAISEHGELFSWGQGKDGLLGYGDKQDQPSPKRIEALRGVRMSGASVGSKHVLALTEDGLLYSWGRNMRGALLGKPNVVRPLLPKPVEALRGVRVGSVLARDFQSYAVADTGEVWAWGGQHEVDVPLGHGEQTDCFLPKPIESLRGVKVDAVGPSVYLHMHVVSDDGSVYTWGADMAAENGALGLGTSVMNAGVCVPTPQRIPALRVACGWL